MKFNLSGTGTSKGILKHLAAELIGVMGVAVLIPLLCLPDLDSTAVPWMQSCCYSMGKRVVCGIFKLSVLICVVYLLDLLNPPVCHLP